MNYNVPFNVPLHDYEGMMNNRQYWDDLGAEWSWSTMEQKLVRLLPLRTVAAALLMTLLYFICAEAGLNTTVVIISAATGVTLGLLVFTMLLIKEQKKDKGE